MPHLPPEILGHIFRCLKSTSRDPDTDLLAASLVSSLWFMEAWPLIDPALFQVSSLTLKNGPGRLYLIHLIRLSSLLVESLQSGLIHCDHLKSIRIGLVYFGNNLRASAAAIHQVVRLQPPNLRRIEILYSYIRSAAMIELLDIIFPTCDVTKITQLSISGDKTRGNEVTIHLLERLGPTLRDVSLYGFQLDATLLEALRRCHGLECLFAKGGWLPGPDTPPAPSGAVAFLAAALQNLTSLSFSMENCDREARVSDGQLREIVTRLPGLTHLAVDVDFTVNDECLRFVMRHAKEMEVFALVGCIMSREEGVWTENDVGWRGRKVGMSSSFTRLL
ncbi:hypothetical protein BC938DRAFT_478244 [Jimgerdemannia flammicorona]|uniref:F-box domain-containing protein n=1 Tax=Jimgerdemannia flammicorona TaxID=994334 RepID=A0A433QN63_9FUNG|nr:hypothetical protein BC938DRAFT_478244 [Jimgerdemannia flammicorona]